MLSLYAENGVGGVASLPFSSATTFVGTVGGVSNVRITSNGSLRGLNITRNSGGEFSTNDIQAVIKGLQIKTIDLDTFIPLEFTFTLVKNGSSGPVSTAYFNADLFSTTLDLDATTAGTQLNVTRIINLAGQAEGAGLFAKPIATPRDVDTKSIQLAFSGTLAVTLDKLVLGSYTLAFDTNAPANLVQTIAGVRDVAISYTRPPGSSTPPQLVLTKTDGSSFTGAQVKAVLEGLFFKTTSRDTSARLIDITLTDQAGNTSTPARAAVTLDIIAPPVLSISLINETQVIYDVLSMKDIFGDARGGHNPKVLDVGDEETFVIPYTDGSTATDFLSRIKGISAAWGGRGIANGPNNLTETTQSYLGFNLPPVNNTAFAFSHQGGSYTKSATLKFIIKTIDGVEKLVLSDKGSTYFDAQDIYNSAITTAENGDGLYALGNINLLYALPTTQPNRTPTVEVSFNGSNATVGALMSLYDGDRLLTSQVLTADNVSQGKVRLTVTESLGKGEHRLSAKYSEVSGDSSTSADSVPLDVTTSAPTPFLSDLKVKVPTGAASSMLKALGSSSSSYANFIDPGVEGNPSEGKVAVYEQGPSFTGTLGSLGTDGIKTYTGKYLVSVNMGGKLLGFTTVDLDAGAAGSPGAFEIKTGANLLAPGFYNDLSFTVTNITPNACAPSA